MSWVIQSLLNYAHLRPDAVAVYDGSRCLTYKDLVNSVTELAARLRANHCHRIALVADNSPEWIIADLAAWYADAMIVPVPSFFTPDQVQHLLTTSRADTLITQAEKPADAVPHGFEVMADNVEGVALYRRDQVADDKGPLTNSHCKVTYTSGSTGTPKGVVLSGDTIDAVARRLVTGFEGMQIARHLCSMPLATLLENIAGVYVPLVRGTAICVPSLTKLGLYGSSRIDASRFRQAIADARAESLILQPQTLRELTASIKQEPDLRTASLRFVAVGGAKVADADLEKAASVGIPAYQGYGLSECASVVALNRPNDSRNGSVGRPLPGLAVEIAADGEILVGQQCMSGYLGEEPQGFAKVATGDLGYLDDDGYLYVTGRKKNVFITSFGRNVSPEWPEAVLLHEPEIQQACVFGEAMPFNTAVLVPDPTCNDEHIAAAIARANLTLPDYARVTEWIVADEAFSPANGLLTTTGKPRRDAIARRYVYATGQERFHLPDAAPTMNQHHQRTTL